MIGRRIGDYEVLELLGRGGMGVVYRARHRVLDRDVALKFLLPELGPSPADQTRLLKEARAASRLNHPNIAILHGIEDQGEGAFLVFEFIPGGTLRSRLNALRETGAGLSLQEMLQHGIEIAEGLAHAHAQGLVHRDIKPENLMFTAEGALKITDFGLARMQAADALTMTGSLLGTPAYMSPEQLLAHPVESASDLFSTGIVLFELASGRLPHAGEQPLELALAIVNEAPRSLAALRPDLPVPLLQLIDECLEKDPARRPASAAELARRLRAIMTGAEEQPPARLGARGTRRAALAGSLAFVALCSISILVSAVAGADRQRPGPPSIAVLTFENMSASPELDSFATGLTEEIAGALSHVPGVLVASRTAVRSALDPSMSPNEMGRSLHVSHVLEGSVRAESRHVRISCQLVDTDEGFHLWTETYDRDLDSPLAVETEVAGAIATRLASGSVRGGWKSLFGMA